MEGKTWQQGVSVTWDGDWVWVKASWRITIMTFGVRGFVPFIGKVVRIVRTLTSCRCRSARR